jgi:hypothetical protein
MRASTTLMTGEADALALRMRKHFAHKVDVELDGSVSRVRIPAGEFELEPEEDRLAVRAAADDEAGLARVQEVVTSHLARFAREGDVVVRWSSVDEGAGADSLEERAVAWLAPYRNARHLVRTRDWARQLEPHADEPLLLAALLHDADRHVDETPLNEQVARWNDEQALRDHCERSAGIAREWLRAQGAGEGLADAVADLVLRHESGGTPDADVLQAADSLSFLETNPAERWVREGRAGAEEAARKLRWMHDRIRLERARPLAGPLLERALAAVRKVAGE